MNQYRDRRKVQSDREAHPINDASMVAFYNAAVALHQEGRRDEAAEAYRRLLLLEPEHPESLNNLSRILLEQGEYSTARRYLERAIGAKPDFAEPHFNLGELSRISGDLAAAAIHYRHATSLKPSMAEAWNNLGNILKQRGDLAGAIDCYRQGVRLQPELGETHYNLGSALREADDPEPAVRELMIALRLKPHYAEAYNNLGLAWKKLGAYDLAIDAFTRAVQANPESAEAHWNRSFFKLMMGDFSEGWRDYEWRYRIPEWRLVYPHRLDLPPWDGAVDKKKRLLVHDEQGLGDTLQFVRYLPRVRERCGWVILETRRELMGLLRGFPGVDELVERPQRPGLFAGVDCCIPLLSLPRIFGTTVDTIPAEVPYLRPDPVKTTLWAERLKPHGLRVGIVWAGRPEHSNDRNRSCPLGHFRPLADLSGISLMGLQKGPASAQAESVAFANSVRNIGDDLHDFSDTAAVLANLDLLVSVDTAVVHLAGAMGKPVWVLLPTISDWRWMLNREDSLWYPTMRLFRQSHPGDWDQVFRRVAQEIRKMVPHDPQAAA